MEWTTKKPINSGWYWAYEDLDARDAQVYMVYVRHPFDDKKREFDFTRLITSIFETTTELDHFLFWMGPILPPFPGHFEETEEGIFWYRPDGKTDHILGPGSWGQEINCD